MATNEENPDVSNVEDEIKLVVEEKPQDEPVTSESVADESLMSLLLMIL